MTAPIQHALRAARPDEAALLSALAWRSKAYWGYDAAFLEACRAPLTVTADFVARQPVFVLEERDSTGTRVAGFYGFDLDAVEPEFEFLYVEPFAIGRRYGKHLWRHAVETAGRLGVRSFTLAADPHAEAFYLAMGAERIGAIESEAVAGRMLPLLRWTATPGV